MTRHLVGRCTAFASSLALLLVLSLTGPVAAECSGFQPPRRLSAYTGATFIATVTEVSVDVQPPQAGKRPFDWHVEMSVDQVYDGAVPRSLSMDGWAGGCTGLIGDALGAGDHLLVTTRRIEDARDDPSLLGQPIIWRSVGGAWRIANDLLTYTFGRGTSPPGIRGPRTTEDILELLAGRLPPTSTMGNVDEPRADGGGLWLLLVASGTLGFVAFDRRRRRPGE